MTLHSIITAPGAHRFPGKFRQWHTEHRKLRASYRQTLGDLSAMTQRELADIGLRRADVATFVTQTDFET